MTDEEQNQKEIEIYRFNLKCEHTSTQYKTTIELFPSLNIYTGVFKTGESEGEKLTASKIELIAKTPNFNNKKGSLILKISNESNESCLFSIEKNYVSPTSLKKYLFRLHKKIEKYHKKKKDLFVGRLNEIN